jgi:phosphatidylglycerol:prolipoprotein diacylglycerol transferase
LLLFTILAVLVFRFDALKRTGLVSGTFLVGYGLARITVETVREPDSYIGFLSFGTTWGQWLSLPMVLYGIYLIATARPRATGPAAPGK